MTDILLKHSYFVVFTACFLCFGCQGQTEFNHLQGEKSPYLLQHVRNPVDWYPWKDQALKLAENQDKLIIISIGYSACHWCHVMEHESFEDEEVARLMNEHFVSIKVDREERPDIDDVYMTACQVVAQWSGRGSCGWPLNIIALPDGRPIYAGTYYPRSSWLQLLQHYVDAFDSKREELEELAGELTGAIQDHGSVVAAPQVKTHELEELDQLFLQWEARMDMKLGGRQGSPKFPMPVNLEYLLKYHYLTKNQKALDMVTITLDRMAAGGIYDQIGGGFARYSTDENWKVPHFEKMLYDNGQLISVYSKAYQITGNNRYREVVLETLKWMAREMTSSEGGFYSSLDADSDGEEGKFYVWTEGEVDSILGADSERYKNYYQVSKSGNWEHKKNILFSKHNYEKAGAESNMTADQFRAFRESCNQKLLKARSSRIRPGLDDKVLTSWNAMMLIGYTDAYRAFGDEKFLQVAIRNGEFLRKNMMHDDFRLNRNYKDGASGINAFLDDYALLARAFSALYEVTFDESWLMDAKGLTDYTITHFYDPADGAFFYTSDLDPPLITRKKELDDNVIPASNSIMARNLLAIGNYFANDRYIKMSEQLYASMEERVSGYPVYSANWALLLSELIHPAFEVAVVGKDYRKAAGALQKYYLPDVQYLGSKKEDATLDLLDGKYVKGETIIYVCRDKMCKFPVTETEEALDQLRFW